MECPICLDQLISGQQIGRIQPCLHIYHETCIKQWSDHSNSCPTCRNPYYKVDITAHDSQNRIEHSFSVKDKLLGTDAINNIPAEFVIPPSYDTRQTQAQQSQRTDMESAESGVCLICSSAQYSTRNRQMMACISCGGKFHTSCLGHLDDASWFCPFCDCYQEISAPPSRSRSNRPNRIVLSQSGRVSKNAQLPGRGQLLLCENIGSDPSLDSQVLEEWHDDCVDGAVGGRIFGGIRPRTSVWNGGVLLRQRERELQNLTPEERSSWDLLESARRGDLKDSSESNSASLHSKRKKRRPRAQISGSIKAEGTDPDKIDVSDTSLDNTDIPSKPSRIASLMGQIRANSDISSKVQVPSIGNKFSYPATSQNNNGSDGSSGSNSRTQSPNFSPTSPRRFSVSPSLSLSNIDEVENSEVFHKPRDLTFEEKQAVQVHVRNNLRPLYRDNKISSEKEYVRINKGISRQVYARVSTLCCEIGLESYSSVFSENSTALVRLVDECVESWIFNNS